MRMLKGSLAAAAAVATALTASVGVAQTVEVDQAQDFHEEPLLWTVLVDRLEHRWQNGENSVNWEAEAFVGGDYQKIWLTTEGEKPVDGAVEEAEIQLLYSRMIGDFWDVQAGIRHDVRPQPQTTYAVLGLQGLAPYFFEVDAQAFLSEDGDLTASAEAEFDLLITQKLILQPVAEVNFALQDVEELGIGAGVSDIGLGLRLRYEIVREFAPYVGVQWERQLGQTADFARAEGEDPDVFSVLAGIRFWF